MLINKKIGYLLKISALLAVSHTAALAVEINKDNAFNVALEHLKQQQRELGLANADLATLIARDIYTSKHNGVTHVYLQQMHNGLEVMSGDLAVNIAKDGRIINVHNQFIPGLSKIVPEKPALTPEEAVQFAAKHLNLQLTEPLSVKSSLNENSVVLTPGGISQDDIPVKLVYQPVKDGTVRLSWQTVLNLWDGEHWLDMRIDAKTGEVLKTMNWVDHADSYKVYPVPTISPEDPTVGTLQTTTVNPADATASPFGWHDTNGAAGREFADTQGNNVIAVEDADANNTGGILAAGTVNGADILFDYLFNPALQPTGGTNQAAAIVNLFYTNNIIHDVFYHYGFDEAAGNFQVNNYGHGGSGSDAVRAEAQDGSGINNANFATPPDGSAPRMQMYLWNTTNPMRDGDFENGIIIHEYGHGISNRLTGGPSNVSCLGNQEQMGEGWSDWLALILTTKSTDTSAMSRGMGPYALGEPNNGPGIRPQPYSTDMTVNTSTYDTIKSAAVPHGVGWVWASMLWDLQWAMIDRYGFDSNLYSGTGGNNKVIQLVIDGMKLQPCSPGFVDGRDAILAADTADFAGANQCLIWETFARRGLGYSAVQGSSTSRSDGTQAFDMPPQCQAILKVEKFAASEVQSGATLDYRFKVTNDKPSALSNVTVTDTLPAKTAYIPGSSTCSNVTQSANTLTFSLGNMATGTSVTCNFKVQVEAPPTNTTFSDDMESGSGNWSVSHGSGAIDWALSTAKSHSTTHAWFASDVASVTDQYLISKPILVSANGELTFWHYYNLENTFDGGVVEISTDNGANWTDLGALMTSNGYNATIKSGFGSPIAGRQAFTNVTNAFIQTKINLSSYSGQQVKIRFRLATDSTIADEGWYIDDVLLQNGSTVSNQAQVTAAEGDNATSSQVTTQVIGEVERLSIPLKASNGKTVLLPY